MSLPKLLIILTFVKLAKCNVVLSSNFITSMVSSRESFSQCIGEVSRTFFIDDKISLVSLSVFQSPNVTQSPIASDGLLLQELFKEPNVTVVLKKTSTSHRFEKFTSKVGSYIIQVRDVSEVKKTMSTLRSFPTWNSQAKFLIVSVETFKRPIAAAKLIINELKLVRVVNGVVFLRDIANDTNFLAYSWMPYSQGKCESNFTNVMVIDQCAFGVLNKTFNWFSNKSVHNLSGCVFKVRAVVWPPYVMPTDISSTKAKFGIEARIIQTMAEAASFSITISSSNVEQNWGSMFANGSATGTLQLLKEEKYDIAIGSFAGTIERHEYLDYVTYNVPESLAWCVPHGIDTNRWKKLLMVIPDIVWFLIVLIYLIVTFCLWSLSRSNRQESTSYRYVLHVLQNSFSVLVNMAVKYQPKTVKTRLLFLIWAYFTLHIAALYQSALISVLTKPTYQQKIKTINDIFDSGLNMWLLKNNKRYFRDDSDSVNKKILAESRDCKDIELCLNDTAYDKNSATCTPRLYMNYVVNQYIDQRGRPLLYCFKESIATYPLEMFMTKDFTLKTYFEILVGRITASGLIAHWEKEIFDFKQRTSKHNYKSEDEYKLSLSHLQSVFVILGIGSLTSIIVFLVELYVFNYYK